MKLLFLTNFYPPLHRGGMELRCQEVVEYLRRRGHTVRVLTSRYGEETVTSKEDHVHRTLHLQANIYNYQPVDFFLKRSIQEQANKRALQQILDDFEPDVTFTWGMWNLSRNLPYWVEQLTTGKVAYSIASYWLTKPDAHVQYWRQPAPRQRVKLLKSPLSWLALKWLDLEGYPPPLRLEHVVCCSQYIRDTLIQAGKLSPSASVIYSGINPTPYLEHAATQHRSTSELLRLVYFGSLLPHKGVHTAIQALGLLKRRGQLNDVHLQIIGSGHPDYEAQLRREIEELGIGNRADFMGQVPRGDLPAILGQYDVFLFCSIWAEPLARTVMEAMAAGLLVIGTEVGGQKEMLFDGENALTFEAENADSLADCISRALAEPALRQRLAHAGQQMVLERFTLERMLKETEAWLEGIVQ
jgi:glycosyltransferase involved in cell wall biosynthesis